MNDRNISVIKTGTYSYDDIVMINESVVKAIDSLELEENYFKPGMNVLIKPNLVMDKNGKPEEGIECLYTQASVVKPVIDYIIHKTKGNVKIVVGDAPMQECIFKNIRGYKELIDEYRGRGINIELVDFRELTSEVKNDVHIQKINPNANGRVINLGRKSEFYGEDERTLKKMRVTNYDPDIMPQHHHDDVHEYYISQYILDADLIINMPKPKTHRKAGFTGALKNLVGANTRKEFLPHHTMGAKNAGGDEYLTRSVFQALRSRLYDVKNRNEAKGNLVKAKATTLLINACSLVLKTRKERFSEGSWYGNDTISRTIIDLNRIVKYADKNGNICSEPQRKMLIIGDMIVSGEKEGPVYPEAKSVGLIVAGTNSVLFDYTIVSIMGFDAKKIPTLLRAKCANKILPLVEEDSVPIIVGDYSGESLPDYKFKATSGWVNHIEK